MSAPKVGDSLPADTVFSYIPYTPEIESVAVCGMPINLNANKEWADKKVVLFALPGAFTPSCSASHLPGFIEKLPELKAKGVDVVACVSFNDAYVMSGWGKVNGVKDDSILFLCDPEASLSKKFGWTIGERTSRYALVIDHGKITYAAVEESPNFNVTVTSADSVLAAL
ncbi:peroxiredoxin-2D [Coleophoma crateriformis]|uniref:Thioredoxin peroxidase n=2 Tax=Coleophoma TaxID=453209 RepID=A0A3D8S1F7_9HELO|nr:peroxiredoxin-2D [Coleophoma cylindrospora]RDW92515.1 peroxiredoxin-2D [Coleophoma crateriformis]